MTLALLNTADTERLVSYYLETGNKAEAYKLFNPQWGKLKKKSVKSNTSDLFTQPLVKWTISDKSKYILESTVSASTHDLDAAMAKHQAIYDAAMEAKQFSAANSAAAHMDALMKLGDIVSQKAVRVERDYGGTRTKPAKLKAV